MFGSPTAGVLVHPVEHPSFWGGSQGCQDRCTGHSARIRYLESATVQDAIELRGPNGEFLLDKIMEEAAWNRVESDTSVHRVWASYVSMIMHLKKLGLPMKPLGCSVWNEPYGGFMSPMAWDGVIGLAIDIEPSLFMPFTWGANNFLAGLVNHDQEHQAFYVDLAICVLDWEIQFPDLLMLDKYKRLGGSIRVSYPLIGELLVPVLAKAYLYRDEPKQTEALLAMGRIIGEWQKSENSWSEFMIRTLKGILPVSSLRIVDSFLLGRPASMKKSESLTADEPDVHKDASEHTHTPSVIQDIEHAEHAAVILPSEAAEVSRERWAGFVENRNRIIGRYAQIFKEGLTGSGSGSLAASSWMESDAQMPPSGSEWTGEVPPRATQLGDTVDLV